jgi:hypothetical protein
MRTSVLCACLLGVALLPCVARADDEKTAAQHFREGQRAFEGHDYKRAAGEFEAANRAKPASAALLSAGLAWELGGDAVNAAIDFAAALTAGGLEARDEAMAREHLAALDAKIGHLELRGPASARVTLDEREQGALPIDVRVTPGDHTLDLTTAAGTAAHRVVTVGAGATARVDLTPTEDTPPPPPPPTGSLQRPLGWISVGVGAIGIAAGTVVGALGLAARDEFVSGGDTSVALHDEAVSKRTWANVLLVSGGVFAATGVVLILTAPRSHAISVGVGPSSATLRVLF